MWITVILILGYILSFLIVRGVSRLAYKYNHMYASDAKSNFAWFIPIINLLYVLALILTIGYFYIEDFVERPIKSKFWKKVFNLDLK